MSKFSWNVNFVLFFIFTFFKNEIYKKNIKNSAFGHFCYLRSGNRYCGQCQDVTRFVLKLNLKLIFIFFEILKFNFDFFYY